MENLKSPMSCNFPFTSIVGQEEMKLALLLNVIEPSIGGVMAMGDRGTGKSTSVRSLTDLLPYIDVLKDDPFNKQPEDGTDSNDIVKIPTPMVDLPLGATEDRVCGTIDLEKALSSGKKGLEPGLLAKANRGILYVDEVNLLDDHLVDVLLDSAASGWNTVEREGVSLKHPARFILIGSGNPEEGELRPQLLDRFGMHAQIGTVTDPKLRLDIVRQRIEFDEKPQQFCEKYSDQQNKLKSKITQAQALLQNPGISISEDLQIKISTLCSQLEIDGLRGDIVLTRAAKAYAAYNQETTVQVEHLQAVVCLCLRHRLRKDPLQPIDSGSRVMTLFGEIFLEMVD